MIVDTLANRELYRPVAPRIARALDLLAAGDLQSRDPGRYVIDGSDLFAIVESYQTKPADACIWESHRNYIDVQYIASGVEGFGVIPIEGVREKVPYDAERDRTFYHPPASNTASDLIISTGSFAVFFPKDVHSPMRLVGESSAVKKVVLKVRVER